MRGRSDRVFADRRRRRNKKQILIPLICAGAFLVAGVIIYLCVFGFAPAAENFYPLDVTSESQVAANTENVYYLSGTTLNCADKKGAKRWSIKFTSGAVNLSVSDTLACVYSSDFATVLSSEGEHMYTLPTSDYKTKSVKCGIGYTAFLSETEETQYIRVFNSEGSEIYRTEYPEEDILDYGFYGTNDSLFTLTLDTSGISPVSRVTTMSPATQSLTGTVDVTDQLIGDVKFVDTNMILCGTSTLSIYDNFGAQSDSTSIYGLSCSDSAITKNGYIYAFLPKDISNLTNSCTVRIIGQSGGTDIDTNIQLPPGVKGAYVSSNKLYCILENSIYIYKLSGEFEKTLEAPDTITAVTKLGEDKLKVACKEEVYLLIMD